MSQIRFRLHITSPLLAGLGHIPMAPEIDFAALMAAAGATGVLDPNSIEIRDRHSGGLVEYALGEDLLYGAQGRIEWVITDPACRTYDISFRTVERRPPLAVRHRVPQIGVGDLLRYNAGVPRPIVLHGGAAQLVDLTGDGRADLVGCWNYYHRPDWPISGVVCYPRAAGDFCFGEMIRASSPGRITVAGCAPCRTGYAGGFAATRGFSRDGVFRLRARFALCTAATSRVACSRCLLE
jgi:hypothetical protein